MLGNKKNILYVSNVCDQDLFESIYASAKSKPSQAAQKFQRLLLEGFTQLLNINIVKTISILPITRYSNANLYRRENAKSVNGIFYTYVPYLKFPLLKDALVLIYTFFKVLKNTWRKNDDETIVVANVLNLVVSIASITACKVTNTKCLALVTDLPSFMNPVNGGRIQLKFRVYKTFANYFINKYDAYILLTSQMNAEVNPRERPHLIMEGLVDIKMNDVGLVRKNSKRIILYAGALYEKYGVKNLVDAFCSLPNPDIELHLYGGGDMSEVLPNYIARDPRIKYFGEVANAEVVKALSEATLLINPRPTHEEFTKYSFPSKNVEYMVSGTPLVCTNLPGMPVEYHEYIYLLTEDSQECIASMLHNLLLLSDDELVEKGKKAKEFVLKMKNNVNQAKRIADFANTI